MRAFDKTTLSGAVGALGPGMRVLMPPGCGEPVALVEEIARQAARLADLTLMGGIHLGDYPYARPESSGLRVATWHMSPRLEDARSRGRVDFVPVRYFEAVSEFAAGGEWAADAVLVHCAPPDDHGYLSLGVSVGAVLPAALEALGDHRDLGLHSLLVDASVALVERGVVTNVAKRFHRGRMDIAEAMGTRRLFDFVHDNVLVNMESSAFVHDPSV